MHLKNLFWPVALLALQAWPLLGSQDPLLDKPLVSTLHTSEPLWSAERLGGLSVDANGAVYVANFGATVWRVDADGRVTALYKSLRGSSGNAIDLKGNLLQASFLENRIVRIALSGSVSDSGSSESS